MKRQYARMQYGQGMELPAFSMMIAGAVSLFTGIFLAFFLEYWQRNTRERGEGAWPATT